MVAGRAAQDSRWQARVGIRSHGHLDGAAGLGVLHGLPVTPAHHVGGVTPVGVARPLPVQNDEERPSLPRTANGARRVVGEAATPDDPVDRPLGTARQLRQPADDGLGLRPIRRQQFNHLVRVLNHQVVEQLPGHDVLEVPGPLDHYHPGVRDVHEDLTAPLAVDLGRADYQGPADVRARQLDGQQGHVGLTRSGFSIEQELLLSAEQSSRQRHPHEGLPALRAARRPRRHSRKVEGPNLVSGPAEQRDKLFAGHLEDGLSVLLEELAKAPRLHEGLCRVPCTFHWLSLTRTR